MSRFGDDGFEMPRRRPIDDRAVEALLTGEPAGDDLAGLAAFVDDVREAAAGPNPVPTPVLAQVLTRGFSTDKRDLPATAASNANGSAQQTAGLPKWRRALMKTSQFVAGLSLAAKVALGAGVAVAATASAGVAGVLPGPVQHAVADAVGTVTPFELPGGSGDSPTADGPTPGTPGSPATDGPSAPGAGVGTEPGSPGSGTPGSGTAPGTPGAGLPGEPTGDPGTPTTPPVTEAPQPPVTTVPGPVDEPKVPESLTISCGANADHHVVCNWSGADPSTFGRYLLLRTSSDGKQGRVLLQSGDLSTTTWDDSLDLTPGVTYGYMILVQSPDGASVAHSPYVYITR